VRPGAQKTGSKADFGPDTAHSVRMGDI